MSKICRWFFAAALLTTVWTVPAMALPDLVPTILTVPPSAVAASAISVSWTVENQGDATATGNWLDQFVLSTDTVWDGGDVFLANVTKGPLGAGASYNGTVTVTLPNVAPGTYYIILWTDRLNVVPELDDANNFLAAAITITKSDLVPTVLTPPASAPAGSSISVSWTVENQGSGTALGSWLDQLVLSTDTVWDGGDAFLANVTKGPLGVGASYNGTVTVTLPNVAPGTYYIILWTDRLNVVPELDDANNFLAAVITITKSDLVPTVLTPPASAPTASSISVSWTVENQGTGEALGSWLDQLVLSTDTVWDGGDAFLANVTKGPLGVGASYNGTTTVTLPNVAPGTYYIILWTDRLNVVPELDDANNFLAAAITIEAPPTATPTLTYTGTATATGTASATATGTATGTATPTATPTVTPTATPSVALCAATPRNDCVTSGKGKIKLDLSKGKLLWKFGKGAASLIDFGDPDLGTDNYRLCIYDDENLVMSPAIGAGGLCGTQPCWSSSLTGRKYKNASGNGEGITQVKFKAGLGSAVILVKGKGANLALPPLPLADLIKVTVQFVRNPGGPVGCWSSVFAEPAKQNDGEKFGDTWSY